MKRRFLVDINVVLDVLLDRMPHAEAAAALWARIERGDARGLLPAHALTTTHYLTRKARGGAFARDVVDQLLKIFSVVAVDERILRRALEIPLQDFEDSVCAACAESAQCDAVVTRDPRGFRRSPVAIIDPPTAIAWLDGSKTK